MEHYVTANKIDHVYFVGFKSRKEIAEFYAISDVLVLPSLQETWGIVVNEALCFGIPVITSDQVGACLGEVLLLGFVRAQVEEFDAPVVLRRPVRDVLDLEDGRARDARVAEALWETRETRCRVGARARWSASLRSCAAAARAETRSQMDALAE